MLLCLPGGRILPCAVRYFLFCHVHVVYSKQFHITMYYYVYSCLVRLLNIYILPCVCSRPFYMFYFTMFTQCCVQLFLTWNTLLLWPLSNSKKGFCRIQSQTTIFKSSDPLDSRLPETVKCQENKENI